MNNALQSKGAGMSTAPALILTERAAQAAPGQTLDHWHASGWTAELLQAHGYAVLIPAANDAQMPATLTPAEAELLAMSAADRAQHAQRAATHAQLQQIAAVPTAGGLIRTNPADYVFSLVENAYINLKTGSNVTKEALKREFDAVTIAGIDMGRRVHCHAWEPTKPPFIHGEVMPREGGWVEQPGAVTMNSYRPSNAVRGDAAQAGPWLDQLRRLYPDHWEHVVCYFAHLAQRPGVKPNHGIYLGGNPGIGKDSILEGVKYTLGQHNCSSISPSALFGEFTPWTKCLMLVINEIHDSGGDGVGARQTYERMKTLTAAPPLVLTYNDKHVKAYPVSNCCGVVVTSNHETGAMYLPPDDRRFYVMWSQSQAAEFTPTQWVHWWAWYYGGGDTHIAALLHTWDLTAWNPKAPPPRTPAWHAMVGASVSDGDMALADALDALGRPDAITLAMLERHCETHAQSSPLLEDLRDRKQRPRMQSRLGAAGYSAIRNPTAPGADGLYRISGKRMTVYAKRELGEGARQSAAEALARYREIPPPPAT